MSIFSAATVGETSFFILAGVAIGIAHFGALRWNAALFLRGALARATALQLARMAATATVLVACARAGGLPLAGALTGMLFARQVVLRRTRFQ